jgi:hypothetical protein
MEYRLGLRNWRSKRVTESVQLSFTFEAEGMVREIRTFPQDRFVPLHSSITIYLDRRAGRNPGNKTILTDFWDKNDKRGEGHTYEGVLVELKLRTGGSQLFMIAAQWGRLDDGQDRLDTHWKWYCWPISSDEISRAILFKQLPRRSPVVERFHQVMLNPDRTQTLSSDEPTTQVSISIASDFSRLYNGNFGICHMHIHSPITKIDNT